MDSFNLATLTEEMFSRLCSVALEKCHDKNERRRAGCGGQAMRKRVLIKNFVADLLRTQNEKPKEEQTTEKESTEWENGDLELESGQNLVEPIDECEDEIEEEIETEELIPLPPLTTSTSKTFVDSDPSLSSLFPDFLESSADGTNGNVREGIFGGDCKLPSEDRFWSYDGSCDNSTDQSSIVNGGGTNWSPTYCEWGSTNYDGLVGGSECDSSVDHHSLYDHSFIDAPSSYGDALASSLFAQPVRAEPQDQLFLSLATNHLAEMKTYTPDMVLPDDVTTGQGYSMTDLDVSSSSVSATSHNCKRVASESSSALYDSIHQLHNNGKRIKL